MSRSELLAKFGLFLFFAGLVFFIYYPAFPAPMYYDSTHIQHNEHLFFSGGLLAVINLFSQRPVPMASFYVNYLLCGLAPSCFRLLNVFVIALIALLFFIAVKQLLEISNPLYPGRSDDKRIVATLLALFFLVHPIQVFLVLYIWQRATLLMCFFYLLSLGSYLATRSGVLSYKKFGYSATVLTFVMAVASKETAITLPFITILFEITLFSQTKKALITRVGVFVLITLVTVALISFLEHAHGIEDHPSGILPTVVHYYIESGLSLKQVIITQCRMLFSYASMIAFPLPSSIRIISPQLISVSVCESVSTLSAVTGSLLLIIIGAYATRKRPMIGLGLLFFVINLIPESFLVPQYLFVPYRASLPMFGLLLVAADLLYLILERLARHSKLYRIGAICLFSLVIILAGLATRSQVLLWTDPVAFWRHVVEGIPRLEEKPEKYGTFQALNNLGLALQQVGRPDEAIEYHEKSFSLGIRPEMAQVALGKGYALMGNKQRAEAAYREALQANTQYADAYNALGKLLTQEGRTREAISSMRRAVELAPDRPVYQNDLGVVLLMEKVFGAAAFHFNRALELNPMFVEAYYNLGRVWLETADYDQAKKYFAKALDLRPGYWQSRRDLGTALMLKGELREAIKNFQEALRFNPGDSETIAGLNAALERVDKRSSAGSEHH